MAFVYSNWYIVMAVLVVAIVALVFLFVKMDKKDRVLIKNFVDEMQKNAEPVKEETGSVANTENAKE